MPLYENAHALVQRSAFYLTNTDFLSDKHQFPV